MAEVESQHIRYSTPKVAYLTLTVATCTYLLRWGLSYIQSHWFSLKRRDMLCI